MLVHLLDMGVREYGDCVVVHNDQKRILIDGAHKGDSASIRTQLKKIFKKSAPFHFDLLIMTHLHDDHIGCLPELIASGDVTATKCLLMDPVYRWGAGVADGAPGRDFFVDAVLEEDHSFLSDDELEEFLLDSETLPVRYGRMIRTLERQCDVKLFKGVDADDYGPLEKEFNTLGLKIIGPTQLQLQMTQEALLGAVDAISDFVKTPSFVDSAPSMVERYRKIFSEGAMDSAIALDASKSKGSINNESIVLKFKADGWTALLGGDMQFADPQVSGLEEEMEKLLKAVNKSGPYQFIKTSHHTSDNGLSQEMLENWLEQGTEFFGHSGGLNDEHHPHPEVLKFLKAKKDQISFARTDRNGLIRVGMDGQELSMWLAKGEINNFAANPKPKPKNRDESGTPEKESSTILQTTEKKAPEKVNLFQTGIADSSQIQFAASIPLDRSVKIIIEIDGEKKN